MMIHCTTFLLSLLMRIYAVSCAWVVDHWWASAKDFKQFFNGPQNFYIAFKMYTGDRQISLVFLGWWAGLFRLNDEQRHLIYTETVDQIIFMLLKFWRKSWLRSMELDHQFGLWVWFLAIRAVEGGCDFKNFPPNTRVAIEVCNWSILSTRSRWDVPQDIVMDQAESFNRAVLRNILSINLDYIRWSNSTMWHSRFSSIFIAGRSIDLIKFSNMAASVWGLFMELWLRLLKFFGSWSCVDQVIWRIASCMSSLVWVKFKMDIAVMRARPRLRYCV